MLKYEVWDFKKKTTSDTSIKQIVKVCADFSTLSTQKVKSKVDCFYSMFFKIIFKDLLDKR